MGYYKNNRKRTKGRNIQYAPITIGYAVTHAPNGETGEMEEIRIPILSPTIKKPIYHEPLNRRRSI